jgi:hypothetical protein
MTPEEIMKTLLLGLARAEDYHFLNYQRHIIDIVDDIEKGELKRAETMVKAICTVIDSDRPLSEHNPIRDKS